MADPFRCESERFGADLKSMSTPTRLWEWRHRCFRGSQTGLRSEIWVPVMMEEQLMPRNDLLHDHHYFWLVVMGRLKPGVQPEQAQAEMTALVQREVKNYPEEHRGHDSVTVSPFGAARSAQPASGRRRCPC